MYPADYDRQDFVNRLLDMPFHKQLLNLYVADGLKRSDFVFYQKSIVMRNQKANLKFPPAIPEEFKGNIEYEIELISNNPDMDEAQYELKSLLEKIKRKM